MMMQTILVAMDWGETSDAVATMTADLALALNASVKAVYVEDVELIEATERAAIASLPLSGDIPLEAPNMGELEAEFATEERFLGRRFLKLVADTRIRGSFLVARGAVDEAILRESRARDLLVMGKYSETADPEIGRRPLGRHVETLIRRAWCPVFLVPPGASLGNHFLVAYDGTVEAHRALSASVRLARAIGADLAVLLVAKPEPAEILREEVAAYLEAHRMDARITRREGSPAEEILQEAADWRVDLIAMGAWGSERSKGAFGASETVEVLQALDRAALLCGPMEEM